jgi:hypothetical protein
MMPLGHGMARRQGKIREARTKTRRQAELARDEARIRLWEIRQRYRVKVRRNEAEMDTRKAEREKSLNPIAHQTMPSRDWAKTIRNPVNWSAVPRKPKYSGAQKFPERIYGKRFEIWEKKLAQDRAERTPKIYQEAAQKMTESVAGLRNDITKRPKQK